MEESIPTFYAGRSILVTGATGFMGKILVEKLLRSCPDVKEILILVRDKRGKTGQERWEELTKLEVFKRVKQEVPGNLENKVVVLNGALQLPRFGLEDECYNRLKNSVSIIFHVAASVRFVEPLTDAITCNVLGTKNVVDFASEVKNLKAFVHVSTTYSNSHLSEVNESIYPPIDDWKKTLKVVQSVDKDVLQILSPKYIRPLPNTYTFSKNLAEQLVNEARNKIPVIVLRPSIVISSWKEPIPGWIDNENGPTGLFLGIAKGVIRCLMTDYDIKPDYMAVDIAIKAVIVAAWKKGKSTDEEETNQVTVYNASSGEKSITIRELCGMAQILQRIYPLKQILWYPNYWMTSNISLFRIGCFFQHFIPALIVDSVLKFINKEPMLLKIQKKYLSAMLVMSFFLTRRWTFKNDNFLSLVNVIPQNSKEDFDFSFDNIDAVEYFKAGIVEGRKFLINEKVEDIPYARVISNRMFWVDVLVKSAFSLAFLYGLYVCYVAPVASQTALEEN